MGWAIAIIVIFVAIIVVGVSQAFKNEKKYKEDYQKLSEDEKSKITEREYVARREARQINNSTNTNVLEDMEQARIIDCPACGEKVSNKAKACPHCGQPIDTKIYCPKCGSSNCEVISGTTKAVTTWAVGVFAANTIMSKHKCKDCGHKF